MALDVVGFLVADNILGHWSVVNVGIPRIPLFVKEVGILASVNDLLGRQRFPALAEEGITPVGTIHIYYVEINHCLILLYLKYCFN